MSIDIAVLADFFQLRVPLPTLDLGMAELLAVAALVAWKSSAIAPNLPTSLRSRIGIDGIGLDKQRHCIRDQ